MKITVLIMAKPQYFITPQLINTSSFLLNQNLIKHFVHIKDQVNQLFLRTLKDFLHSIHLFIEFLNDPPFIEYLFS
jgi:hypothetical protein